MSGHRTVGFKFLSKRLFRSVSVKDYCMLNDFENQSQCGVRSSLAIIFQLMAGMSWVRVLVPLKIRHFEKAARRGSVSYRWRGWKRPYS
ncbi:hypothetical protein TNCV_2007821 [Trichonephila clavipes]|nr:hypothetical protein TNCV_2007821 [Trichonephila clavipes]